MKRYIDSLQDTAGNAVGGATVIVTLSDGSTPVLYMDSLGLTQYPSNVVTTDEKGVFWFYAEDGLYDIEATKGTTTVTRTDVEIVDALLFSSSIDDLRTYAHYLNGSGANQITVTTNDTGDLTITLPQDIGASSDVQHRDMVLRKLRGSSVPTLAQMGASAGVGAVGSIVQGDDLCFQLDFTTGTSTTANGLIAQINWGAAFAATPIMTLHPNNLRTNAVQASATSGMGTVPDQNKVLIQAGTAALAASSSYSLIVKAWGK